MIPKYPDIIVNLSNEDGNAFNILNKVQKGLRNYAVPKEERDLFFNEAISGDYDHLLQTCMKWVKVS